MAWGSMTQVEPSDPQIISKTGAAFVVLVGEGLTYQQVLLSTTIALTLPAAKRSCSGTPLHSLKDLLSTLAAPTANCMCPALIRIVEFLMQEPQTYTDAE